MGAMAEAERKIIPAAGRFIPVGAYDALAAATMREGRWRPWLADEIAADAGPSPTLTEVGAGTGSLTRTLRARMPGATITAVEPDPGARAIAADKAGPGDEAIAWVDARADSLPLADGSQDAVVIALVLHHLTWSQKVAALSEIRRVLKPGGALYVADFGRPQDPLMAAAFAVIQLADGFETTRDHRAGRVPHLVAGAGFDEVRRPLRLRTPAGTFEVTVATTNAGTPGT
jgi:ubiquinone/menaquinone biosynthesis C-methylase UbiE